MASTLESFSNDLASAVEAAGRSAVAVNGRPRTPSSGIHWRAGIVVTTNHMLQQEADITVTTLNGDTLAAAVAGRDPSTDAAILKVPGLQIPVSEPAGAASVRIGHIVLAIGRGITASLGAISSISGPLAHMARRFDRRVYPARRRHLYRFFRRRSTLLPSSRS